MLSGGPFRSDPPKRTPSPDPIPVAHRVAEAWLWIGVVVFCLVPLVGYLVTAVWWWISGLYE